MMDLVDRNSPAPCHFCRKDPAALADQSRQILGGKDRQRKQHPACCANHLGMIDIGGFRREPQAAYIESCRCPNNRANIGRILYLLSKDPQESRLTKNLTFIPCWLPDHSEDALR